MEPKALNLVCTLTMRRNSPQLFTLLLALLAVACTTPRGGQRGNHETAHEIIMDPLHLGIHPDPELGLTDFDAPTLFHEGLRLHEAEQPGEALKFFDRLLSDFPESRLISTAAFNAGRCLESLDRDREAVDRYRLIVDGMPRSKDWVDTTFRLALVLIRQDQQSAAVAELDRLLGRESLSVSDRIDAMVLKGESLSAGGKPFLAETVFRATLRIFRQHAREEYLDPSPAARAEFRLSELLFERFKEAPLRLPEDRMREDLEQKARLLLKTQAGFLRSMRYGDPDWATAASYGIGCLYLDLHEAMNAAPVPPDLSPDEVKVYRELLRKRLAVLLRKALKIFKMTMQLAERTRSNNEWTQSAQREMEHVEKQVLRDLEESTEEALDGTNDTEDADGINTPIL